MLSSIDICHTSFANNYIEAMLLNHDRHVVVASRLCAVDPPDTWVQGNSLAKSVTLRTARILVVSRSICDPATRLICPHSIVIQ